MADQFEQPRALTEFPEFESLVNPLPKFWDSNIFTYSIKECDSLESE